MIGLGKAWAVKCEIGAHHHNNDALTKEIKQFALNGVHNKNRRAYV